MSDTKNHGYIDPNDPLHYAPPRVRERAQDLRSEIEQQAAPQQQAEPAAPQPAVETLRKRPPGQLDQLADAVARALQESIQPQTVEPQPIKPQLVEPPPEFRDPPNSGRSGLVIGFGAAAAVAAAAVLIFVFAVPSSHHVANEEGVQTNSLWQSLKPSAAPERKQAPKLAVHDGSGVVDEALPLGVSVAAPSPGAFVTINGLPAGARMTVGKRTNNNEWRVPARDIASASVIPPSAFAGAMDLSVELSGEDGSAQVSSFVRLSWLRDPAGSAVPAKSQAAPSAQAAPAVRAEPAREIDPKEVAGFVRRAQELLASGDLQPARLLLMRAAEARDPRAAFTLARTYDPIVLKQFGSTGPEPDLALARVWYQKAKEWGASDAQNPLDALASYGR